MRAAVSAVLVGAVMLSRRYRAWVAVMLCVVVLAVLPVTVATVVQAVPLVLTWMVKSRVFQAVFSPPAPACLTTTWLTVWVEPRSTCSHLLVPCEHHLSRLPPVVLPLTAFAGP